MDRRGLTFIISTAVTLYVYLYLMYKCDILNVCFLVDDVKTMPPSQDDETAAFCLSLPGRTFLSPLLALKKFRKKGNKDGALRAFYCLQEEGLGKVLELSGTKGVSSVSR